MIHIIPSRKQLPSIIKGRCGLCGHLIFEGEFTIENDGLMHDSCYFAIVPKILSPVKAPDSCTREQAHDAVVRTFDTGANRDLDDDKLDLEGFLSPLVLQAFGEYMHEKRKLPNGDTRDSDNWQKGIPLESYMKSGYRHFFDWWREHRGYGSREGLIKALCGLLFNVQGYLHETLKKDRNDG